MLVNKNFINTGACIPKSKRYYKAKPSAYNFYVRTKMPSNFHFCIRVPLRHNFKNKNLLKGKRVSIKESPSKDRMAKLNEARETYGFRNVWTSDSKIFFKDEKSVKRTPCLL